MFEINTKELNNSLEKLNNDINEYEEIQLNIFNQLKESCLNWQDGNSKMFESAINDEKKESDLILQNLKDIKKFYESVSEKCSSIGTNISCNIDNKQKMLTKIDECYYLADDIIRQFNLIDRSFYYDEIYAIENQKQQIINVRSKLSNLYYDSKSTMEKLSSIEKDLNNKSKEFEEIKINDFDYNFN